MEPVVIPTNPSRDQEHLRLLAIFHYVLAGMMALFSFIPLIHLTLGIAMLSGAIGKPHEKDELQVVGGFFVVIALGVMFVGFLLAAAVAYAGRCLARRKNYTYCFIVAAIACLFAPLGTVLGVFTIIVLMREGMQASFGAGGSLPPAT